MKKDFITVTPDNGTGNATITVSTEQNAGDARSIKLTVSASGMNRTISINQVAGNSYDPETAPNGVYILHTNGKLYLKDKWETAENEKAVGVALKTENCAIVISPNKSWNGIKWGLDDFLVPGCVTTSSLGTSKTDYAGVSNTNAIIERFGDSQDYAAKVCRDYSFKNEKNGYLPSNGELWEIANNSSEIDSCLLLIGGDTLFLSDYSDTYRSGRYLSSTQYDGENACVTSIYWRKDGGFSASVDNNRKRQNLNLTFTRPICSLL